MTIVEGSAKVRSGGVVDDEENYALPVWAGVIPIYTVAGAGAADGRLLVDPALPRELEYTLKTRLWTGPCASRRLRRKTPGSRLRRFYR